MTCPTLSQLAEREDGLRLHLQLTEAERRSKVRYPLVLKVLYRALGGSRDFGEGRAVNMSSGGAFVLSNHNLGVGAALEVRIEWPSLLDGRIPLQLVAFAKVVRCGESSFAVSFGRHQFRTLKSKVQPIASPQVQTPSANPMLDEIASAK